MKAAEFVEWRRLFFNSLSTSGPNQLQIGFDAANSASKVLSADVSRRQVRPGQSKTPRTELSSGGFEEAEWNGLN